MYINECHITIDKLESCQQDCVQCNETKADDVACILYAVNIDSGNGLAHLPTTIESSPIRLHRVIFNCICFAVVFIDGHAVVRVDSLRPSDAYMRQ